MSAPAGATHPPSLATQAVGRNLKCRDRWQWNQSRKDMQGLGGDTFLEVSDLPKSALPFLTHGLVLLPHLCMGGISHRACSSLILSLGRLQPSNSEGGCSKGRSDQVTCTATAPCSLCQPNPGATDRTGSITLRCSNAVEHRTKSPLCPQEFMRGAGGCLRGRAHCMFCFEEGAFLQTSAPGTPGPHSQKGYPWLRQAALMGQFSPIRSS